MVLGRLAHYAIDALLLSAVVAGVKRSTGFACVPFFSVVTTSAQLSPFSFLHSPDTEFITNPTIRSFTESYLGFGETVFNAIQGTVVTSPYFKRSDRQ